MQPAPQTPNAALHTGADTCPAAILDAAEEAIISENMEGLLTSWNPAAARLFGYAPQEAVGRPAAMLFPPELQPEEERLAARLKQGGRPERYHSQCVTRAGRRRDISVTASPVRAADGTLTGISRIMRDITEQNSLNAIVISQKQALEQAMRGAPLPRILEGLLLALEKHVSREASTCFLLLRDDRLYFAAGPGLPAAYREALAQVPIGPSACACAAAAYKRAPVIATDIATDPEWGLLRDVALAQGLRACWSVPLFSGRGQLLGTFAMYYGASRAPAQEERDIAEYVCRTAGIIIEHRNEARERARSERSLSEETRTLETLNRLSKVLSSSLEVDAIISQTIGALTQLTHARHGAFYYNRLNDRGASDAHGAASAQGDHAGGRFLAPRQNPLFRETFAGHVIRIADLPQHPEYARLLEDNAIPAAFLPIRSFLALPVVARDGAVLGGLFFGHPEAGVFDDRAVRIAESAASCAAVSIDNAQLYQQMKESQQRWKALTEAMPQLVWVDRADGECEYLSAQWERYSGIPVEQLLGDRWLSLLHPDDRPRTVRAWSDAMAERAPYDLDYRIRRGDGVYRWFRVRGVPIRDEYGGIVKWYGTCTDIQELVESRDAAEAASIAKSEFLANMSHEIRTPMNAVVGLANILAMSGPLTERQQEFVRTLQLSAGAMLSLINDLLDISRIEARSVELEQMPFSVVQVVEEVVSMMAIKAHEKGLTFAYSSDCACIHTRTFIGDPARLRQIMINLCGNALKFTEKGGVEIVIRCEETGDPGMEDVFLTVRDTGIGIAPDHIRTIFDKFVQADSSINRKYGGTGLGLAITRTLAELMGGSIGVASELGGGSEFIVHMPLRRVDSQVGPQPQICVEDAPPPSPSRLLLVEDYPPNVLVATTFLEQFGYRCDVAANGFEAVDRVRTGGYALVLMDVQMHGMNGMEATRAIRAYEKERGLPPVPIIGMTAHVLHGDREHCLEAGMDDYIAKPFDPPALKDKIAQHLRAPLPPSAPAAAPR